MRMYASNSEMGRMYPGSKGRQISCCTKKSSRRGKNGIKGCSAQIQLYSDVDRENKQRKQKAQIRRWTMVRCMVKGKESSGKQNKGEK